MIRFTVLLSLVEMGYSISNEQQQPEHSYWLQQPEARQGNFISLPPGDSITSFNE